MYGFEGICRKEIAGNRHPSKIFGGKDSLMILTNIMEVRKKVDYFNRIGIHYEAVYHYVVRIRELTASIYTNDFLDDITAGLISFDMQRFMGNKKYMAEAESWACLLKNALKPHRATLKGLRKKVLQDVPLGEEKLQKQIIRIFEDRKLKLISEG